MKILRDTAIKRLDYNNELITWEQHRKTCRTDKFGAAIEVHKHLGPGLPESAYE